MNWPVRNRDSFGGRSGSAINFPEPEKSRTDDYHRESIKHPIRYNPNIRWVVGAGWVFYTDQLSSH